MIARGAKRFGSIAELVQAAPHQPHRVGLVVDREALRVAEPLRLRAQDARAGGVERHHPHHAHHAPDQHLHALAHLLGGLVGERDREDLARACAAPVATRWAMRCVSTRVFPEPAPASTSSGPVPCVTASRWGGLSPSSSCSARAALRSPPACGGAWVVASAIYPAGRVLAAFRGRSGRTSRRLLALDCRSGPRPAARARRSAPPAPCSASATGSGRCSQSVSGPSGLRPSTRTGWPGLPTTVAFGGTSWITTEFAPTLAPWPTVIGPSSLAPEPIVTLSSTVGWRLPACEAGAAQRDALEQGHAVADLGRLADHDPGAVVDEEVAPDARGRMDLDPGHDAARVRQQARHERHVGLVQRVRDPVREDRVHARVGEQDLRRSGRARGRVAVAGRRDVLAQLARHACDRGQPSQAVAPSATSEAAASSSQRLLRRPQTVERAAPVRDHERHAGGAARLLERDRRRGSPPRRRGRAGSRRRSPPRRRPDSSRPGCPYSARRASRPPPRRGWTPRRACREATARRGPRGRRFRRRRRRRTRPRSRPDGRRRPTREPGRPARSRAPPSGAAVPRRRCARSARRSARARTRTARWTRPKG